MCFVSRAHVAILGREGWKSKRLMTRWRPEAGRAGWRMPRRCAMLDLRCREVERLLLKTVEADGAEDLDGERLLFGRQAHAANGEPVRNGCAAADASVADVVEL